MGDYGLASRLTNDDYGLRPDRRLRIETRSWGPKTCTVDSAVGLPMIGESASICGIFDRQSAILESQVHTTLDLWSMLFVFMLATFVGFQVIQNVSRLLHTPLMSLTNAISAIAIVGSIIIAGEEKDTTSLVLGCVAVAASMTNIVSGFLITDRMLKMFREKGKQQ
jgi:NAD(P) transhydrogenase subunit alpha